MDSDSTRTNETRGELSALLDRWRSNDTQAFREIVCRFQGPLLSYVMSTIGHLQDAEDVVQETLIRAHRSVHQLREAGAMWMWLRRIAHNAAIDLKNRARRQAIPTDPEHLQEIGEQRQATDANTTVAGEPEHQGLTLEIVIRAIESLPETYRLAAVYHFLEEWPHEKIAVALGIEPATARQRISRAGKILRNLIREFEKQETERHDM